MTGVMGNLTPPPSVLAIISVSGKPEYFRAAETCARSLLDHTPFAIIVGSDEPEKFSVAHPERLTTLSVEKVEPDNRSSRFMSIFTTAVAALNNTPATHCLLLDADCLVVDDLEENDVVSALADFDFGLAEQTTIRGSTMGRPDFLRHFSEVGLPVIDPEAGEPHGDDFRYWNSGVVLARSSALLELSEFALSSWAKNPEAHVNGESVVTDQDYFQYWGAIHRPGSFHTLSTDWNHCYWWDLDYPRPTARIRHYSNFTLGPSESTLDHMARDAETPGVTALLVAHNSDQQLPQAISSVIECGVTRVLVWDNGSPLPTAASVGLPNAETIRSPANLGFARAANALVNLATTKYVVLVNPDVVVDPETFDSALHLLETSDAVAVAPDQEVPGLGRIPALQHGYTRRRLLVEILLPRIAITGNGGWLEKLLGVTSPSWTWISGACVFLDREKFLDLGGFDEDYFLYMEDVELGARASHLGYTLVATGTSVRHAMSAGSEIPIASRVDHLTRARITFARKHFGGLTSALAWVIGKIRGVR